jgi:ankyrin repeat protein
MITKKWMINEDKYKKLPENVDYVIVNNEVYEVKEDYEIVNNEVYEVKEDYEMIYFMSKKRLNEYIEELTRQGRINESNKNKNTIMMIVCKNKMESVAMKLIPRMSEEAINKQSKEGETALMVACKNGMKRVAMELIPKMNEEAINKWNNNGRTALIFACRNKMERVIELIKTINNK